MFGHQSPVMRCNDRRFNRETENGILLCCCSLEILAKSGLRPGPARQSSLASSKELVRYNTKRKHLLSPSVIQEINTLHERYFI